MVVNSLPSKMYQPMGLQKLFVQVTKPLTQRKLSNLLITFFAMAQLCFGFNFGFAKKSGKFKTAIKFITSLMGCVMMATLAVSFTSDWFSNRWVIVYFLQYVPTFFILMSAEYTLCEFLTDITETNEHPGPAEYDKVGFITWLYTSLIFIIKIVTAIIFWSLTNCTTGYLLMTASFIYIPMLAQDIVPVANNLLFFHVFDRTKKLKIKFERNEINEDTLLNTYKAVADSFDKFRSSYDAIFIWGFLTEFPKWIFLFWNHINLMKSSNSWLLYTCSYVWALHITLEICVPAVFAEMINVQTDGLKMILQQRMLDEKDGKKTMKMDQVLKYMKARSLLKKAWRLLPLDLRLPVAMLSMCTTYLIVIIQFTHLFD